MVTGRVGETKERTPWDQTVMLSIRALDAVLGKISGLSGTDVRVWKNEENYRIDMDAGPIVLLFRSRGFYRPNLG